MKKLFLIPVVLCLFSIVSCNGGGINNTPPTISSLVDKAGNALTAASSTSVTTENMASFVVTFSTAMSDTAVEQADSITLSCTTAGSIVLTVTLLDGSAHSYSIVPASIPSGGDSCTMAFAAAITDSSGTALAAVSYPITVAYNAPAVSLLKDSSEATVEQTGTTGVLPNSFTVTFSEAMDDTTVTSSNISVSCNSGATLGSIGDITANETKTEFTIPVTGLSTCQLQETTMTFGAGIKSAAQVAMTEIAYIFTAGCAVDDTFTSDTREACWTVSGTEPKGDITTWTSWSQVAEGESLLDNVLQFNDALVYSNDVAASSAYILKNVNFDTAEASVILHLQDITGLATQGDGIFIMLGDTTTGYKMMFGLRREGGGVACTLRYVTGSTEAKDPTVAGCTGSEYYLQLSGNASSFSAYYKTSADADWTSLVTDKTNYGGLSATGNIGIFFRHVPLASTTNQATIVDFTTSGITSDTQY